jgi:glycosidase
MKRCPLLLLCLFLCVPSLGLAGTDDASNCDMALSPSPMPRPDHYVTIYQAPVRTYLATGMGKDSTGKLASFTSDRLAEIAQLGADYVWLTGAARSASPDDTDVRVVKGDAGSYFAINDNWDVNPQLGTMDDFTALVARAHAAGLRVMIDLVVNHTARKHHTHVACKADLDFGVQDQTNQFFARDNNYFYIQNETFVPPSQSGAAGADGIRDSEPFTSGSQIERPARVTGNNVASAQPKITDWYETAKLNYGYDFTTNTTVYSPRPRTWDQMLDVALYWVDKGVDGFRIDMAHAVPLEFWRYFVGSLRAVQPNVFLVAEAYEQDEVMKAPGFTYEGLLGAGVDTIFNMEFYQRLAEQGQQTGRMPDARLSGTPALRPTVLANGYVFTNFLENHDQVRVASGAFAPQVGDKTKRGRLGLALSAYAALMPAHFLIQGGQEVLEDGSIYGPFSGDNGKTSIFDFVYQSETRKWLSGDRPQDVVAFREAYQALLTLRRQTPFSLPHSAAAPSFVDLYEANWMMQQSDWVASYLRYDAQGAYLVVTNSDPLNGHEVTIHFTPTKDQDPLGALAAAGIQNSASRYRFTEVLSRPGWVPLDPSQATDSLPGSALYSSGGVPSGLYLGTVPAATTYVFWISSAESR